MKSYKRPNYSPFEVLSPILVIFHRFFEFPLQILSPVFCFLFAEKLEKWPGDKCRKLEIEILVYSEDSTATVLLKGKKRSESPNFKSNFYREPGNSQFSGTSTKYSGKETTEEEEGRKTGTSEVSNSLISRKFPADNFCQSLLTEILQRLLLPDLDRHRKKTKADRSRSFDAVPANTMTAEENNITFN
ncbi:Protein CBG10493 [Caenorhabditis briggsae]|uniref:Protein CBG10493 n=1 Tax=Caenorhabditis briggsae TaxID=6238 RepID=A8XAX7_CAEBR|nr:Protein CBG10493 [Caenorhabditis briggsae]CAP29905.1 Protein CBG10493 [Caenorhabditis briggsae]